MSFPRALRTLVPVCALAAVAIYALVQDSGGFGSSSLTLYSGQHPETVASLVAAFERRTGIRVAVRSGDEDVLADQVVEEGGRSPADVFLSENSPPLEALAERGLLARVDAPTLAESPRRYDPPSRDWVALSARVSVLVYNTRVLSAGELPRSVLALGSARWRGRLGLAPTETDFQPIVTAVAARYGQSRAVRWLEALRTNAGGNIYPDNETLVAAVNDGQAELGVINHYYWYRLRDEVGAKALSSAEHLFAPGDPGYVIDVSGAGVLATSHHQRAAERFVAFLASRQGQEILAHSESYEYPLDSGVRTAKPLVPFTSLHPDSLTISQLGDGRLAIRLLREASLL